jgi:hypothetical protein
VRHFPPNQLLAGATIRSGLVNSLLNLLLSVTCCGQFHNRSEIPIFEPSLAELVDANVREECGVLAISRKSYD